MGTYTANYQLYMPSIGEQGWGDLMNGNLTTIDTTMKGLNTRIGTLETETDAVKSRVNSTETNITKLRTDLTSLQTTVSGIQTNGVARRGTLTTSKPVSWATPISFSWNFTSQWNASFSGSSNVNLAALAGWDTLSNPEVTTTYTIKYSSSRTDGYSTGARVTFTSVYNGAVVTKQCACGINAATYTVTAPVLANVSISGTMTNQGSGATQTFTISRGTYYVKHVTT